jgi:hypothetical protein
MAVRSSAGGRGALPALLERPCATASSATGGRRDDEACSERLEVLGAAMLGGRGAPALPLDAEAAGGAAGRGAAALKGEGGAAALLMLPDAEEEAP